MSISGAIASSSAGRCGPRGSLGAPVGYRRPSQPKDHSDLGSSRDKAADDKRKGQKEQQGGSGTKVKSSCVLLVAMGIVTFTLLSSAVESLQSLPGP